MPIVKLTIHPDAENSFNKESLSLLELCKESKYTSVKHPTKSGFPEPYIAATLTSKDIANIELGMRDGLGERVARYFPHDNKQFGLEGDNYKKFVKLCESIQKAIRPSSTISREAVEDQAFQWLSNRYSGSVTTNLVDHILPQLEEEVKEFEIWIPIGELRLEGVVEIGNIQLRPITKELLDQWKAPLLTKGSEEHKQENAKFFEEKIRKPLQGWPAAFIKLRAEPKAAKEIALYETERSLAALRLFTPAALFPKTNCYIAAMGSENVETVTTITFQGGIFAMLSKWIVDNSQRPLALDNSAIAQIRKSGLDIVSQLLCKVDLTDFEESLLDSLTLYSNATKAKELASKIVYILASLEGIFLKNDTEPIQQNLGERIATLIGKNLDEKKNIIKNIKTIYGTRSAFLHHAHSISQFEDLERFMYTAFIALTTAIQNHDRFPSKQEYISAIDDLKLTGTRSSTPA